MSHISFQVAGPDKNTTKSTNRSIDNGLSASDSRFESYSERAFFGNLGSSLFKHSIAIREASAVRQMAVLFPKKTSLPSRTISFHRSDGQVFCDRSSTAVSLCRSKSNDKFLFNDRFLLYSLFASLCFDSNGWSEDVWDASYPNASYYLNKIRRVVFRWAAAPFRTIRKGRQCSRKIRRLLFLISSRKGKDNHEKWIPSSASDAHKNLLV